MLLHNSLKALPQGCIEKLMTFPTPCQTDFFFQDQSSQYMGDKL